MYIRTEETPNPEALKFIPGVEVTDAGSYYFKSVDEARSSFLARKLLSTSGIDAVFFGNDFITITKNKDSDWFVLKPEAIILIMDHFSSGLSAIDTVSDQREAAVELKTEIEKQIFEIIETRVRPSVAMDGGDIIYRGFEDGIVKLELKGACSGCPSSTVTLKNGIESMLKHYVPEVISVEEI